ncbi:ankyrin repeat-containing domain protein [Tricladium varicosporioides]|nr:ankyrin repeat-containing domain protein [Hymenoscyphus varicosporioides]
MMNIETFEREIPAALSITKALENHPDDVYLRTYDMTYHGNYIADRVMLDGKSKVNLSSRLHKVLEVVLPDVSRSDESYKDALKTLAAAIVLHHEIPDALKLINGKESLPDDTFGRDCLHAGVLLGRPQPLDVIEVDMLEKREPDFEVSEIAESGAFLDSSLVAAALGGHLTLTQQLLDIKEKHSMLPIESGELWFALLVSIIHKHEDIVRLLLKRKYSFETFTDETGPPRTLIPKLALRGCSISLVLFLCDRFDVDLGHDDLLRKAARHGRMDMVEVSLAHDADPKNSLVEKKTPLAAAAFGGQTAMIHFLLSKGVDPNKRSKKQLPIYYAAMMGYKNIVKMLLDAGANINSKTRHSPLYVAALHGHADIVEQLLDLDLDIKGEHKEPAVQGLIYASARGHDTVTRILIRRGVDKEGVVHWEEEKDIKADESPMMAAHIYGQPHIVRLLLELGAKEIDPLQTMYGPSFKKGSFPTYQGRGVTPILTKPLSEESAITRLRQKVRDEAG